MGSRFDGKRLRAGGLMTARIQAALLIAVATGGLMGCTGEDDDEKPAGVENAKLYPFGYGTVTGEAVFNPAGMWVQVDIKLNNCPDGVHTVHIHDGNTCGSLEGQSTYWGMNGERGVGIPPITCSGGVGAIAFINNNPVADKVWTLDGNPVTDPRGKPIGVDGPDQSRVACGMIK